MPLDRTTMDLAALEAAPGFLAAFRYEPGGVQHLAGQNEDANVTAEKAYDVWRVVSAQVDADLLLLKAGSKQIIVSRKGGLIVTARSSINIGLLRQAFKSFPVIDCVESPRPACFSGDKGALWSIVQRLARVEAPRTFEIMLGSFEYVLQADNSGFTIFDEDGGADRFVAKTKEAVEAELALEYTFGETPTGTVSSRHKALELLGVEEADTWRFDRNGWPLAVTSDAAPERVFDTAALIQSLELDADTPVQVDVLDGAGRFVIRGRSDASDIVITKTANI